MFVYRFELKCTCVIDIRTGANTDCLVLVLRRCEMKIIYSISLQVNEDQNYAVFISYVEIYNNFIYDLLEDSQDAVISR